MTLVLLVVIASTPSRVVTTAGPLPRIVAGMPVGVEGVTRVTVATETLMYRDRGAQPTALWRLVD